MICARLYPDDTTLAVVEASTMEELQAATGAPVFMEQADPDWPFSAIVPAYTVQQLLAAQLDDTLTQRLTDALQTANRSRAKEHR